MIEHKEIRMENRGKTELVWFKITVGKNGKRASFEELLKLLYRPSESDFHMDKDCGETGEISTDRSCHSRRL